MIRFWRLPQEITSQAAQTLRKGHKLITEYKAAADLQPGPAGPIPTVFSPLSRVSPQRRSQTGP